MRIISVRTLREFWEQPQYRDAEDALCSWNNEAKQAKWKTPQDIKNQYHHVSIIANNRAVFNISGNKYRLIVALKYDLGIAYIRFIGTHEEYDKIDAATI